MKLRFPLYARMLTWFFLNLLLLALIGFVFFKAEFHIRLSSLFVGHAQERIQSVADVIHAELNQRPRAEWNSILKLFSDSYHLQFYLFRNDGQQLAGNAITLPAPVHNHLRRPLFEGPRSGAGPGVEPGTSSRTGMRRGPEFRYPRNDPQGTFGADPENNPETRPGAEIQDRPPTINTPPDQARRDDEPRRRRRGNNPDNVDHFDPREPRRPEVPPVFMLHSSDPSQYWAGIRMEVGGGTNLVEPALLLAASDTMSGGGLFVDYKPWIVTASGAILISILFWFPLARGLTQSISQLTHVTDEIAAGRFEARADTRRGDELGRLAQAINQMADRLNGFVTGQKRFLGDTAHELCSPIARMQLALGILEERKELQANTTLADLREEVQLLGGLVNELLSFSKASIQPASVRLRPVNLLSVAQQAIQREAGDDINTILNVDSDLLVQADSDLLLRSLCNLLRNAVRYASQAGPITISAQAQSGNVCLKVTDCGPGIPEDAIPRIFDPFYRPELSRDRQSGGTGLGLAIVKTCIESCQGTVSCQNVKPTGFEVTLNLREGSEAKHPTHSR
jgi:two-component system sensor histidine kinase CpxA